MILQKWLQAKRRLPARRSVMSINVTSHEGYGGDIEISVGISEDGTVTGIEMLSYQ